MNIRCFTTFVIIHCLLCSVALAATPPDIVRLEGAATRREPGDILGGDDRIAVTQENPRNEAMDIDSQGHIYLAYEYSHPTDGNSLAVRRSTDGGATFSSWGEISYPAAGEWVYGLDLVVAEGLENRCYVAFTHVRPDEFSEIVVAWEDLSSPSADFGERTVPLSNTSNSFSAVDMVADDDAFADFFLYLVAEGSDVDGRDIWFTNSIDFGGSWDVPYQIGSTTAVEGDYVEPSVSHSFGSLVHATWEFDPTDEGLDSAILYRSATNDALSGLTDWGITYAVTPANDGVDDRSPRIASAHNGSNIVLAYDRFIITSPTLDIEPPVVRAATDLGEAGFAASPAVELGTEGQRITDLVYSPVDGSFSVATGILENTIYSAPQTAPATWTERGMFLREPDFGSFSPYSGRLAFDPTRGNRLAVTAARTLPSDIEVIMVDAEWLADPGSPIQRPGFPIVLSARPTTDPALADLDGDGHLEIIYGDDNGEMWAIRDDGTNLPGWPVAVDLIADGPIAVGQLSLNDELSVVVGTYDGHVVALDPSGAVVPGWPVDIGTEMPVYVSIGALGGPFPRTVVAASGQRLVFLDHAGRTPPGAVDRNLPVGEARGPAAIGDLDGDGVQEVVYPFEDLVFILKRDVPGDIIVLPMGARISDAITLGDIDLDGDLEIAVPLEGGAMHLLEHTGVGRPGWPVTAAIPGGMRSAAWADVQGSAEPELAFADASSNVYLVDGSGSPLAGYPLNPHPSWSLRRGPVIAAIEGARSDVLVSSLEYYGFAWDETGADVGGWPLALFSISDHAPVIGDLDQDGYNDVVHLTNTSLRVVGVRTAPGSPATEWPMTGHDVQRTGCADCPTDLISAVDEGDALTRTRVSFAAPRPNPTSGNTLFNFSVPVHAAVSLDVVDVRGRRVRTVERREMSAGDYVLGWDGRDQARRPVGTGVYFARLKVSGPGVNETITRKIVVVR